MSTDPTVAGGSFVVPLQVEFKFGPRCRCQVLGQKSLSFVTPLSPTVPVASPRRSSLGTRSRMGSLPRRGATPAATRWRV
jgi:hypothetical protein